MYLSLLTSGSFGGTTWTEMRERWTLDQLLSALDHLSWLRAVEQAPAPRM